VSARVDPWSGGRERRRGCAGRGSGGRPGAVAARPGGWGAGCGPARHGRLSKPSEKDPRRL